ncbi:GAF domain-containing protein [bacterium]|nr:GAF domain-containing protein [bacterium]
MTDDSLISLRITRPGAPTRVLPVESLPVRFGRGDDCAVVLDDVSVSRRHAELDGVNGRLFLRDLKSLNGVRLNGELTLEGEVVPGDVINVGVYEITVVDTIAEELLAPITSKMAPPVRPEGTGAILEVIRAIDIDKVLKREEAEDAWATLEHGEDAREQYRRLHEAYSHLLVTMNLVSSVGNYSHSHQLVVQFTSTLRKLFPLAESVAVIEVRDGDTSPRVVHQERGKDAGTFAPSQPSRTVLDRVLKEMRAIYAVDARRDPRFRHADSVLQSGVRSMMCAPLVARGTVIGAIYVENVTQPFCYTAFDLNLLTVFAFHLAIALETAGLLEERDKAFEKAAKSIKAAKQDKIALILQYSQSEKKFRALFEQSALGAAVINLVTGRIEEVNDGLVRMLGYTRRKLAEMDFKRLYAPGEAAKGDEWLKHVRENGEGSTKTRLGTNMGETIIALQSCRALRLGDSEVMVAYFIDITAKERAEEETLRQLARVTALSELSQSLMTTMNAEAIHKLLFRQARTVLPVGGFAIGEMGVGTQRLHVAFSARHTSGGEFVFGADGAAIDFDNEHVLAAVKSKEATLHSLPSTGDTQRLSRDPVPDFGHRSAIVVPLASRNLLIGVVRAESLPGTTFDKSHLETLRAMAAQAALALSNAHAFEAIRKQEENLRQLSLQIMSAQETERGRISRELHDGVGQQLTAMKYLLEGIRNAARIKDEDKLQARIGEARELATQIIQDLRAISLDLRPTMLDDLGLQPTLEWFVRQYADRHGIEVELDCQLAPDDVPQARATAVYRIIQEAFGNAAKHSQATLIRLAVRSDDQQLAVEIIDNGIGFDASQLPEAQKTRGCSGMLNMKERAHLLGGDFGLETAPGKGTKLSVAIPIKEIQS